MNFKQEIITDQGSFIISHGEQLPPKFLFKQKRNLEYPKFEYKNQSLNEILQDARNTLINTIKNSRNEQKTWRKFQEIFNEKIEESSPYKSTTSNFNFWNEIQNDEPQETTPNIDPKTMFRKFIIREIEDKLIKSALNFTGYFNSTIATHEDHKKWAKFLEFIYYNEYIIKISFNNSLQKQIELISGTYYTDLINQVKNLKIYDIKASGDYIINIINDLLNYKNITFPKTDIDNYFFNVAKDIKIAELWNEYGKKIIKNGVNQFYTEFEIEENIINYFANYIMDNLESIVESNVLAENKFLESIQSDTEFIDFKIQYKIIEPLVKVFFNSNNVLKPYNIELHSILKESHDERKGTIKPFLAAGRCSYDSKIFMNTDNVKDNIKWGKIWTKTTIETIFLHELGHAIDYAYKKYSGILLIPRLNNTRISEHPEFRKLTKCAYKTTRGYSRRQQKIVNYYVYPKIITKLNSTIPVKFDWNRAYTETFAESFAIISGWLVNGFTKVDTYTIQCKTSNVRLKIKTIMKALHFVLDCCNWEYLGVPHRTLRSRKRMIKQLLNKIDNMPIVLRNGTHNAISSKIQTCKKPILRKLIATTTFKERL